MLAGHTACRARLDEHDRTRAAEPLAGFLRALHSTSVGDAIERGAGPDGIARLDIPSRLPRAREHLKQLAGSEWVADPSALTLILDRAPPSYIPCADTLVHGDLYARHLLINEDNGLTGVIDWGDLHVGDRAVDLAIAHTFLPASATRIFRDCYGPIDSVTWAMARLRGLWHTLMVLIYARSSRDTDLIDEARRSLLHLGACAND
jgi:aminoglycoside phosphotransferase (APT) family kinase protein